MLLACKCLNIKLYVRLTEDEFKRQKQQNLTDQDDYIPTGFFPSEVEVTLDTTGITQEHSYLVHRHKHGSYLLFRCLNCRLESYAMHINGSPIVANGQLLHESSVIERLTKCPDYSKVFNIVLLNKDTPITSAMPDPKSASYESVQSTLNSLQKQLSDFIIQEETVMETRIREFEEEQKERFAELQDKLKEEKKRMISLLISAAQYDTSAQEETRDSSKRSTESKKLPAKKKTVSRMRSLPPTLEQANDDPMFEFDGLEASEETFYKDSSSSSEEDNDQEVFEERPVRPRPKPKLTYSASVPISVPVWGSSGQRVDNFEDTDDQLTPSEPDQIAASMQALAQSITDDNRYIFGDRPRPRLNTAHDFH